jgi:hypothetical protein
LTNDGNVPELAVTVPEAAPLKATEAAAPFVDKFPEMLHVWPLTTAKFTAETLPLLRFTTCDVGVNVTPDFAGVSVYDPFASPANE